jgi:hypothetical protein
MNTIFGLGGDVVEVIFEPLGLVGNLTVVDVISELDEQREGYVGRGESARAGKAPAPGAWVGLRRRGLDCGDLKGRVRGLPRSLDEDWAGARRTAREGRCDAVAVAAVSRRVSAFRM